MATTVKVGDRVRYLNAVGGGIVTRFQNKEIILVEEADGFETPVLVREVVVVPETNAYNFIDESPLKKIQDKNRPTTKEQQSYVEVPEVEEKEIEPDYSWNERDETPEGEVLSLYLAFVPKDIKQLQTTDMQLYIINDSNYFVNFSLASGDDKLKQRLTNTVEPQTKVYLETINKLALNDFQNLRFQAFAYKNIPYDAKPAVDIPLRINPTKFYKLHSFAENDYFEQDAMLVTIIKDDVLDLAMTIDPVKLQAAIVAKSGAEKTKNQQQRKRIDKKPQILEVDLHINELIGNTAGLERADMLKVQLDKFDSVMRENIKKRGQKIVFIHGKGEGILRSEIEKKLRKYYQKCQFQDASFQQYGFGATQVTIR
ncbi:MAG: DUF2027 domain-containing protein [bacterium]